MSNKVIKDSNFKESLYIAGYAGMILIFVHVLNIIFDFNNYGIIPRNLIGIRGIFFSPLLHGSWSHLFSNLPPLLFMLFLIRIFYQNLFWSIFLSCYLLTGVSVWLFGKSDIFIIGASGVVYALVSFVFWAGVFTRNTTSIFLSLLVIILYSSMFSGVLPTAEIISKNISWESHLIGGIVGIVVAWTFKDKILSTFKDQRNLRSTSLSEPKARIFPPDLFEKTKWERSNEFKDDENNQWFR